MPSRPAAVHTRTRGPSFCRTSARPMPRPSCVARAPPSICSKISKIRLCCSAGMPTPFVLGDRLGYERLRPFVERWGRWLTVEWKDVEKASAFFRRHGQWVVFALRFSPFLRTMISLPAGLAHMRHGIFLLFTLAGAAVWNAALILGGSWLSRYLEEAQGVLNVLVALTLIVGLGGYIWRVCTWKSYRNEKVD
ncbi:DedA family protein [Sphingobium indicum]|nr:DedA family protein [Sphingobium indicum]